MRPSAVVWLVARREMAAKLRDTGFLLSTAFILVAILASALLPAAFGDDSSAYDVGVVGSTAELEAAVRAQADAAGADIQLRSYDDFDTVRSAITADDVEAAIDGEQIIVDSSLDATLERILNGASAAVAAEQRLVEAGIDPSEVSQALTVPPLEIVRLDSDAERNAQRQVTAFLGVAVLYGLLILMGQYVAMGVVEEKSSRWSSCCCPRSSRGSCSPAR